MRPNRIDLTLENITTNGVFLPQTLTEPGQFILNGPEVNSNGQWVTPDGLGRLIFISSVGDTTAINFTITGYVHSDNGALVSETISGSTPGGSSPTSNYFFRIVSVTADSAVTSDTRGTTSPLGFGVLPLVPLNHGSSGVGIIIDVTGAIEYTVEYTGDDLDKKTPPFEYQNHSAAELVDATTSQSGNLAFLPSAIRVNISSYTAGATISSKIFHRDN